MGQHDSQTAERDWDCGSERVALGLRTRMREAHTDQRVGRPASIRVRLSHPCAKPLDSIRVSNFQFHNLPPHKKENPASGEKPGSWGRDFFG